MTSKAAIKRVIVFSAFLSLGLALLTPATSFAFEEENRTRNRTVLGSIMPPDWMFNKPDHYEFLPLTSNHDPQHQHPAAWAGQDWDPSQWNARWTPDQTLQRIFRARIFERHYMSGKVPVVEVGPTFFKISDLDQRRTLKLLTDQAGIFQRGHKAVQLVDWHSHKTVGTYTTQGMFLN